MGIVESIVSIPPFWLVFFIALIVNVISTLVYKYTTDQKKIKELKTKQKELQKEIKSLQKHPEKAMKKQKEMMAMSSTMMKQTMKPMLYTFIPLILLFMWISSTLVYEPLMPNQPFTVTVEAEKLTGEITLTSIPELEIVDPTKTLMEGTAVWGIQGDAGTYNLIVKKEGFEDVTKKILITTEQKYEEPISTFDGNIKSITIGNDRVRPFGNFVIFGWKPGMIGAYVILSIAFSFGLRKAMGVA